MSNIEKLREDVAYIRAAAVRSDVVPCRSIYLLWAAIALCGFTMRDFAPEPSWINLYWLIAAPGGIVLSVWLGKRASIKIGQANRQMGFKILYHWLAFLVAGLLGVLLVAGGHLSGPGFGSLWVLLLALTYFHAGLHFDRRLLPVGIIVGLCYCVTIFVPEFGWTFSGVVLAGALTVQAFLGQGKPDAAN